MKHLIIGAGAAGISAARTLLRERPGDRVILVSEDREVYSRCMLHRFIAGERDAAGLNFINDRLLDNPRLEWIKGKTVTRLEGAAKRVYAGDEELASADTLVIATGARSVTPPIGDLKNAGNVYGLRHLADARAVAERAEKARRVVIIGAGLVGLDAAYALIEKAEKGKRPLELTVIEMVPSLLALNLDPHAAGAYQRLFEKAGVTFHLGHRVVNTRSAPDGEGNLLLTGVEIDTGEIIPCDMAILAVGVRPATGFLAESGVKTEGAALVNEYLETNVPGIYAAGDAAGLSGIWPNAQKQGETAARNIAGWKLPYTDRFALKNTVNFFGLLTLSVGRFTPQEGDELLIKEDRLNYRKIILRDGMVQGVILQGDIGGSGFWQQLIKNKIPLGGRERRVWKLSYADFFGMDNNGEYRWVV
jgi:NAD(P)H-nitrite reductase large subunit